MTEQLTEPLTEQLTEPLIEELMTEELSQKQDLSHVLKPIIAIDAGGVLVKKTQGDETEVSRKPIEGAFEALTKLKELGFELVLVSFAGRKTAVLNIEDMEKFYPKLLDRQIYCKNKLEKLAICRSIGAIALIDDTLEILETLIQGLNVGTKKYIPSMDIIKILFTGDLPDDEKNNHVNENIMIAHQWSQVVTICEKIIHGAKVMIPDDTIELSKYVYCDLCKPEIKKSEVKKEVKKEVKTKNQKRE